jgi:hypothetical protein
MPHTHKPCKGWSVLPVPSKSRLLPPRRTTVALGQRLFTSLDLDASGGVSIKEFLIGLERMVLEVGRPRAGAGRGAAEELGAPLTVAMGMFLCRA